MSTIVAKGVATGISRHTFSTAVIAILNPINPINLTIFIICVLYFWGQEDTIEKKFGYAFLLYIPFALVVNYVFLDVFSNIARWIL